MLLVDQIALGKGRLCGSAQFFGSCQLGISRIDYGLPLGQCVLGRISECGCRVVDRGRDGSDCRGDILHGRSCDVYIFVRRCVLGVIGINNCLTLGKSLLRRICDRGCRVVDRGRDGSDCRGDILHGRCGGYIFYRRGILGVVGINNCLALGKSLLSSVCHICCVCHHGRCGDRGDISRGSRRDRCHIFAGGGGLSGEFRSLVSVVGINYRLPLIERLLRSADVGVRGATDHSFRRAGIVRVAGNLEAVIGKTRRTAAGRLEGGIFLVNFASTGIGRSAVLVGCCGAGRGGRVGCDAEQIQLVGRRGRRSVLLRILGGIRSLIYSIRIVCAHCIPAPTGLVKPGSWRQHPI